MRPLRHQRHLIIPEQLIYQSSQQQLMHPRPAQQRQVIANCQNGSKPLESNNYSTETIKLFQKQNVLLKIKFLYHFAINYVFVSIYFKKRFLFSAKSGKKCLYLLKWYGQRCCYVCTKIDDSNAGLIFVSKFGFFDIYFSFASVIKFICH